MRIIEVLLMTLAGVWQGLRQDFNLLEIGLILGVWWAWKHGWIPPAPRIRLFGHPAVMGLFLAAGTVALRLALIPVLPVPIPLVNDEFSYLLLADTLLHGRMTNPTHPFWQHFESIHILQQPYYVSNYFPGHAVILAAARAVVGSPWAAILLECFAFLAVLYWMLRGWMPARWALFGVLLAALRFGIGSYWINSYYGGFLAAIGGALIAGAFPRLRRRPSVAQGFVLGAGLAILAATRPFEGLLFSLPFVAVLAWEMRRQMSALLKMGLPALAVSGAMLVALGVYFFHITGSPFVTPYEISQKTYGWPMSLAWKTPPHIEQRHIELARYYDFEMSEHETVDGPVHLFEYLTFRLQECWRFFLGPALTIPLIMLGRVWNRRRMLIIGLCGGLFAILFESAASPHYLAPATAMIVAVVVECCRYFRRAWAPLVPLLPATMALVLLLRIGAQSAGLPYTQKLNFQSWCCKVEGNLNKARIAETLHQLPGKHLVFVQPKKDDLDLNLYQWIYNDADIDASDIVWARDLGPERNAQLEEYFAGRQVWMVDPNANPAACHKYERLANNGVK
jgi:hypothetical protein